MNRMKLHYFCFKNYRSLIFLVLSLLAIVSASVFAEYTRPQIEVTPGVALIDQKLAIRLINFIPDQIVTLNVRLNFQGVQWVSHATYQVDKRGMVDLSTQPSLAGSFQGIESMGLFESLTPIETKMDDTSTNIILFTVTINGQLVAAKQYIPTLATPGTIRKVIRSDGLVGTFYYPGGSPGTFPGIIMLGGAEGGLNETRAAILASHGYAALALGYFGMENLPPQLSKIKLDYLEAALNWLQNQPMVDKNRMAVMGFSKGAELALLMSSYFPKIRATVAYAPSAVVWQSPDLSNQTSSWVYHGKQLSYVPYRFSTAASLNSLWSGITASPMNTGLIYQAGLKNEAAVNKAFIPVEKINGPVLLISGKDDHVWPSFQMAEMIMQRLRKYHHPYPDKNLSYPGAGNITELFYFPSFGVTLNQKIDLGGNQLNNYRAGVASWVQVLNFLNKNLKQPGLKK